MKRWIFAVAPSFVVSLLAACSPGWASTFLPPTPDARATEARIAMNIFATLTASAPTTTRMPTVTVTPPRANPSSVKSTPRPSSTRTVAVSPQSTSTATRVPSPTKDAVAEINLAAPIAKNTLTNLEGKWEITHVGDFRDKTVFNESPDLNKSAQGMWVTIQFRIRNLQTAVTYLGGDYRFAAFDQDGKPYEEDADASRNAGWQYGGCDDAYDNVQPGQETVVVITFDVPEATKTLKIALKQGWSTVIISSLSFQINEVDKIRPWKAIK